MRECPLVASQCWPGPQAARGQCECRGRQEGSCYCWDTGHRDLCRDREKWLGDENTTKITEFKNYSISNNTNPQILRGNLDTDVAHHAETQTHFLRPWLEKPALPVSNSSTAFKDIAKPSAHKLTGRVMRKKGPKRPPPKCTKKCKRIK